jgi:hypothetical protein
MQIKVGANNGGGYLDDKLNRWCDGYVKAAELVRMTARVGASKPQ